MAYHLTDLIVGLEQVEVRNFKVHVSRYNIKEGSKKLTLLFDEIKKNKLDEYSDDLLGKIMPKGNKNALYRLKNRLVEEVENSLVYLHRNKNEEYDIYKNLQLFQIFLYKSDYTKSLYYLKKAEKIALKLENYNHLVAIYRKFIQLSQFQDTSPEIYIKQQDYYRQLAIEADEVDRLMATINHQLKQTNFSGKNGQVVEILEGVYEQLEINTRKLESSARMSLAINRCIRDILLQRKEFKPLSDFLITNYESALEKGKFSKSNHEEKIKQLSWIINALSKAKLYDELEKYIEELYRALLEHQKLYFDKYIWLYYQSKVILYTTTLNTKKAIELLVELKEKEPIQFSSGPFFFVYVNLTTLYYTTNQLNESLGVLAEILINPSFNSLSPDWKLSLQILELIIRVDNEDFNYAFSKCQEVRRKYRSLFQQEEYQVENDFVKLLAHYIRKPDAIKDESFKADAQRFIDSSPNFELGSNELINYPIWLKAKMQRKKYQDIISNQLL